tara:strand:+ start:490 stop:909 length:420 start_codon:yes stop_codon:yes gene_type:complete
MSPRPGIDVEIKGPLVSKGAKLTRDAMEDATQELIEIGEGLLYDLLRPKPMGVFKSEADAGKKYVSKGTYRGNVKGYPQGLKGRITDGGKVVYGPWLEFGGRGFKGYATFRRVRQELEKKADDVVEKHIRKAVKRMRGR